MEALTRKGARRHLSHQGGKDEGPSTNEGKITEEASSVIITICII
jgi:hypothetical protein